jgi:hypothetical protein
MRFRTRRRLWGGGGTATAAVLLLCGCGQVPGRVAASAAAPVPPGSARLWFYRDYEPSITLNDANVLLNGAAAGTVLADGSSIYRDVAPGHYHIAVASFGHDTNQERDIDLTPGQEGFAKILAADQWEGGGDTFQFKRDTFYVSLVPPQIARGELANHPLSGG